MSLQRYEFFDSNTGTVDDTELYFTPNDNTIQFRSCRRGNVFSDFGANSKRMEKIRIGLCLEQIPILRNRRRKFVFGESPFDDFGPPTIMFESAIDEISSDMADASNVAEGKKGPASIGVYSEVNLKSPVFSSPSYQMYESIRRR